MVKIVVFLDAAHQRKYIDVLSSAMAGSTDVQVEAVDISADDSFPFAEKETLAERLMRFKPFRLFLKFFLAIIYVPYAVFIKLRRLYRSRVRKYFRSLFNDVVHSALLYKPRTRLRKLAGPYRAQISSQRKKASGFTAAFSGRASALRNRARRALRPFRRQWLRPIPASMFRLYAGAMNFLRDWSFLYAFMSDRSWQRYLDNRIFSLQPDLIVLLEDNAQGLTGLVSHAARKRLIPFVILPDYIPNPAEPARYYFNDPAHSANTATGRLVRLLAARWIHEYDGKQMLRLPVNAIFSRWMRGQHCPQPWILNAGYTDTIFLESKAALRHYERLGFKSWKLKIIGGAIEDDLHALNMQRGAQRQALMAHYALDPALPLVVCGFPPDQYTAAKEGFEFESYEELCRNWFDALKSITDRANVLVVRHPRTKAEVLAPYATDNVNIADRSLESVLPLSDLYVACISTTIRWALALGIPVINYDTYRYNYGDFSSALACIEVTSAHDFRVAMENALLPRGLDNLKAVAAEDSGEWGLMDGMFKERLRESLIEIHRKYRGRPQSTHLRGYRLGPMD